MGESFFARWSRIIKGESTPVRWTPQRRLVEAGEASDFPVWARHIAIGGYREQGWTAFDQNRKGKAVATGKWGDQLWPLEDGTIACTAYPEGRSCEG